MIQNRWCGIFQCFPKVQFVPEDWTEIGVPTKDVQSFAEFIDGYYGLKVKFENAIQTADDDKDPFKYGYVLLNEAGEVIKAIDRSNPNKKWDWWQIGGRWSGLLQVKPGAEGHKGEPGVM